MGLAVSRSTGTTGRSRRLRAVALTAAALTGFGGAAAVDALAGPTIAVASDFGPGDGLTRYVVTAASGDATPDLLAALDQVDGVDSAQRLFDGSALVAVAGVGPQQLRAVPGVVEVTLSPTVPVAGTASDPFYAGAGWNLENTGNNAPNQSPVTADADIDGSAGWDAATGEGIIVAVVDTGYDSDHPDLGGALWTNPAESCGSVDTDGNGRVGDCHGWNFTTNSADVDNGPGGTHGTSVAGVIAARKDNGTGSAGVAPDVTVMPLVIGTGGGVDVMLGADAIRYAADHGAAVINASWGGAVTGYPLTYLRDAVAYAASKGALVVAAAGNDQGNRDTSAFYPASLTEPNVVTVGASTASDAVSSFSAYGATAVDLFAPGTMVFTTWNDGGYRLIDGTSIAAPQVAAALALYRQTMPLATTAELKAALLADVDQRPAFAGRSVTGGRLDVSHLTPASASAVSYRFSDMSAPAGTVSPQVDVTAPAGSGAYAVTFGLGMEQAGEVWALADTTITLDGATATTDDAGQVTFPLGTLGTVDGRSFSPTVDLAEGRYALTVQLVKDAVPAGSTYAAPLLVGDVPQPGGGTDPGTPTPGTPTPGTPAPGTPTPGTPTPGTPADPAPGTTDPSAPGPGTPDPTTPTPGSPADPAPGTTDPSAPGPGTPDPGTPGPGTDPVTPAPTPDVVTYPEVGPFGITSVSPATVSTAGGTRVTITGTDLPDGARVLVGGSRAATVVSSSATTIVFTAPAAVAGVYDVAVFNAAGTVSSTLDDALTYVAGSDPGTTPTPDDETPAPGGGTGPDATDPSDGSTGPVTVTGPDGQRLVRSAVFGALRSSFWLQDCSASCRGLRL